MRIIAISDTHLRYDFSKLPEADILIHAGDAMNNGYFNDLLDFVNQLNDCRKKFEKIIYVGGNHDKLLENSPTEAKKILKREIPNIKILINQQFTFKGVKFWGSPITPRFGHWAFMADRGPHIKSYWDKIPKDTDVLITHGPPQGILDTVHGRDERLGCIDLMARVKAIKPKIHIFGHIHGSYGSHVKKWESEEVGNGKSGKSTKFYNVAICDEYYDPLNKPTVIKV